MARLIGFRGSAPKKAGESRIVDIVESGYRASLPNGDYTNAGELDGVIAKLAPLAEAGNEQATLKVYELQAKRNGFVAKAQDLESELNSSRSLLAEQLRARAEESFSNPLAMVGSFAEAYGDAERSLLDVFQRRAERYGVGSGVDEDLLSELRRIREKSEKFATFDNELRSGSQSIGDWVAVYDGDPSTGDAFGIDFVNSSDLQDGGEYAKGYLPVDQPFLVKTAAGEVKLPMVVRTGLDLSGENPNRRTARVGQYQFLEEVDGNGRGTGRLTLQGKPSLLKLRSAEPGRAVVERGGVDLSQPEYRFNGRSVPKNSTVVVGSSLYYVNGNGDFIEFRGATKRERDDAYGRYLSGIGVDPKSVPAPTRFSADVLTTTDGSGNSRSRVVETYDPSSTFPVAPAPQPATAAAASAPASGPTSEGFFAGRSRPDPRGPNYASIADPTSLYGSGLRNRPPAQAVARESAGGQGSPDDIVSKGKQFFRKLAGR